MDFDYTVVRSARKTLGLQVCRDGKVIVRAPLSADDDYIAKSVDKHREWIEQNIIKQKQRAAARPEPNEQEIMRLRQAAKEVLPQRVRYFSDLTGLYPTSIKITAAKSRFGSCSAKNGICFSLFLMQYPLEAIDYVVLHELAHIKHHNHSAAFYSLIEKYMPDYKRRRAMLR